jgi:deoxyribose-phosphate aldolase
MVLTGGGFKHRRAYGVTNELAKTTVEKPVSIPDFHATIHAAVGLDPAQELSEGPRPVPITDGGRPIAELFQNPNTEELMTTPTLAELARMLDHSLLQPTLTDADLERGCLLAREWNVASVCIKPYAVRLAAKLLAGSSVQASTVVGFPHGGHLTAVKVFEAERAIDDGATELDMVVNIGKVLSGEWNYVAHDIAAVVNAAHARHAKVKVIFENAYLKDDHKKELCRICGEVRADWVKTSTGYAESGATLEDLKLMREHSPPWVQVKAAGGVRTFERLLEVRAIGVTRVGATATAAILDEARRQLGSS